MKITSFVVTLIISLASGSLAAAVVPGNPNGGQFGLSCDGIRLATHKKESGFDYVTLEASCRNKSGGKNLNKLDLTNCIENDQGTTLHWKNGGSFDDSCVACQITKNDSKTVEITCSCFPTKDVRKQRSTINLNDRVRNEDGILWCGDKTGSLFD